MSYTYLFYPLVSEMRNYASFRIQPQALPNIIYGYDGLKGLPVNVHTGLCVYGDGGEKLRLSAKRRAD